MVECIFTIDYEIYGNGAGSLREQVFEPAERLKEIFLKKNARFVTFVESAELEIIEAWGVDQAIDLVKKQIHDFHCNGFEIGLHLHPQWYNARRKNGSWLLDENEYNLCVLPRQRIEQIVNRSLQYLEKAVDDPGFKPIAFRNSNWLFQPSQTIAEILAEQHFKLDSSVFKGGFQQKHHLDYRRALKNGYYWKFGDDVNVPDPHGRLLEIPIYTQMAFPWQMVGRKRVALQHKAASGYSVTAKLDRLRDFMRIRQPLKLDFCRLTLHELIDILAPVLEQDKYAPELFKPIVLIGHTKDLVDYETVELFLDYLREKDLKISTFSDVLDRCQNYLKTQRT